jgi:hypothetical protein
LLYLWGGCGGLENGKSMFSTWITPPPHFDVAITKRQALFKLLFVISLISNTKRHSCSTSINQHVLIDGVEFSTWAAGAGSSSLSSGGPSLLSENICLSSPWPPLRVQILGKQGRQLHYGATSLLRSNLRVPSRSKPLLNTDLKGKHVTSSAELGTDPATYRCFAKE